jgi:RNA polymerase sigma-70 factor (ECF subfamily)
MASTTPITRLLTEWAGGSALALEQLTPLVYAELRSLAAGYLRRESPGHILQNWESRHHFYGVAAHLMRLILVDSARRARADKRGGGVEHTVLKDIPIAGAERLDDLLALDEAMTALEALDPRKVKIIELRYFGGMTVEETAKTIGASTATVERDTRIAQLWLSRHLTGGPA